MRDEINNVLDTSRVIYWAGSEKGRIIKQIQQVKNNDNSITCIRYDREGEMHLEKHLLKDLVCALTYNTYISEVEFCMTINQPKDIVRRFFHSLQDNTHITSLTFTYSYFDCERIQFLRGMFDVNTTITNLSLLTNTFTVPAFECLTKSIKYNTTITNLKFSSSAINASQFKQINEMLKVNSTITKLSLSHNRMTIDDPKVIHSLSTNTSLLNLDLSVNDINKEGAKIISDILRGNSTLTTLDLSYCQIKDEGFKALINSLLTNTSLKNLNVACNWLTSREPLYELMYRKASLENLDISMNNIVIPDQLTRQPSHLNIIGNNGKLRDRISYDLRAF